MGSILLDKLFGVCNSFDLHLILLVDGFGINVHDILE